MGFILMKTSVSMCANIETGGRIGEEFMHRFYETSIRPRVSYHPYEN